MTKYTHLLENLRPEHYDLKLEFDNVKTDFSGSVKITGTIPANSKSIKVHGKQLEITSASINSSTVEVKIHDSTDEIELISSNEIEAGSCEIALEFKAKITKPMQGIYPCFFEHEGKKKQLIATQFESHHAREAFPCIDEPSAKTTFALTLVTPAGEEVFANTNVAEKTESDVNTTTKFENSPIMSTYLLAFAFGDLVRISQTAKDGTEVGIIATPENADKLDFALDVSVKVLDFYNDYFQIPFPLEKVDHIALPDFAAGAMENWGLITYRESALLFDPAHSSVASKQRVAIVIAHELAHQWFGNLVTMKWWTDLWLNEGFASWMEYLAIDEIFPDWHMWTQFIADDMFSGMSLDALSSSHPVEVEIGHPDEIRSIFDAISYSKGASMIRMLDGYMGAEQFRAGIQHYLTKHSYDNADTADLWQALEHTSGKPVSSFMSEWTSKTGFPVVSARFNGDKLELSQSRYLVNPNAPQDDTLWPIPLHIESLDESALLDSKQSTQDLSSGKSRKLNFGQTGFYSVAYDQQTLATLTSEIKSKELAAEDRMGLINDTWLLAKSGDASTVDAIKMLKDLENEDNTAVWDVISGQIGLLKRALGDDELIGLLRPFVGRLSKKQAERLGWVTISNDSHFDRLMRPTMLGMACFGKDENALSKASNLFSTMKDPRDIQADLRGVVMVNAAIHGDVETFDKLLAAYKSTQSAQIKAPIIAAMTSFKQPELVQRALDMVTNDEIKLQEIHNWIGGLFANRYAKTITWNWLKENWQWFVDNFGSDIMTFAYIPKYAAVSMNTVEELKDYVAFFESAPSEGIKRQIEQGRETIEWQTAWRERDLAEVKSYLKSLVDKD